MVERASECVLGEQLHGNESILDSGGLVHSNGLVVVLMQVFSFFSFFVLVCQCTNCRLSIPVVVCKARRAAVAGTSEFSEAPLRGSGVNLLGIALGQLRQR